MRKTFSTTDPFLPRLKRTLRRPRLNVRDNKNLFPEIFHVNEKKILISICWSFGKYWNLFFNITHFIVYFILSVLGKNIRTSVFAKLHVTLVRARVRFLAQSSVLNRPDFIFSTATRFDWITSASRSFEKKTKSTLRFLFLIRYIIIGNSFISINSFHATHPTVSLFAHERKHEDLWIIPAVFYNI